MLASSNTAAMAFLLSSVINHKQHKAAQTVQHPISMSITAHGKKSEIMEPQTHNEKYFY
jgi:hypothetical protein